MSQKRNERALKTIRQMRFRQEKQAKKIDILCRDMVSAHTQFSQKLAVLTFAASFYESLLGCSGLEETLHRTVEQVRAHIPHAGAAVFLLDSGGFDVHLAKPDGQEHVEKTHFQAWFNRDIVHQIGQTNRICTLADMLQMGLMAPPSALKTLSAAAVPLGRLGHGIGFILIYCPAERPLQDEDLSRIAAVAAGVRQAILSCKSTTAPTA